MSVIIGFLYKYFFEALMVFAVGMLTKALVKQFGNDRAQKIKETILSAMLWAEETFGIGQGQEKWTKAWQKIIELLKVQGIKLKDNEVSYVRDLMKSNIPEINAITYSALPEKALELREVFKLSNQAKENIEKLRSKYKEGTE